MTTEMYRSLQEIILYDGFVNDTPVIKASWPKFKLETGLFLAVIGLIILISIFLYVHSIMTRRREYAIHMSTIQQVSRMRSKDRREYYNYLFSRTGNELTLTSDQIVTLPTGGDIESQSGTLAPAPAPSIGDDDSDWEEEDPSQYLSLSLPSPRRSFSLAADTERRPSSPAPDVAGSLNSTRAIRVRGTCIICFEIFRAGDTIVYNSKTKSCPHVYHKACMVDYLTAKRAQKTPNSSGEGGDDDHVHDDPHCPTCRQPFCRLLPLLDEDDDDNNRDEKVIDAEDSGSEELEPNGSETESETSSNSGDSPDLER